MTASSKTIQKLLSRDRLDLPKRPRIVDIKVTEDVDSLGDDALRIFVVLDENEVDEMRRWKSVAPIRQIIHESLVNRGIGLWPYIRFVKPSELLAEKKL